QAIAVRCLRGKDGEALADGGGRNQTLLRMLYLHLTHGVLDPAGNDEGILAAGMGEHNRNVFTAPAPNGVLRLDVLANGVCEGLQHDIAKLMAVGVVITFEEVDV